MASLSIPFDIGLASAVAGLIACSSTWPFCYYKRLWPEIGPSIVLFFGAVGTVSGFKLVFFTLTIEATKLGPLADDRAALMVGGLVTLILGTKEGVLKWREITTL